jgi:hypothetical protein
VEVHRDDTVHTSHTQQVGHELGSDADTGFVLAVLTCPAKIGDDGIDGTRRCTLGSVNHQQQFHQVVAVGEGTLYEKDITSTDTFLIRDRKFPIGEFRDLQLS